MLDQQRFALVGVLYDGGVTNRSGSRRLPQEIRRASLMLCDGVRLLFEVSPVHQHGDAGDMALPNTVGISKVRLEIERQSRDLMPHHHCVFWGGDHSITLGLMRSVRSD